MVSFRKRFKIVSEVYLCRVGRHSHIGKFRDIRSGDRPRGQVVVLRTARGIEMGEVLNRTSKAIVSSVEVTGAVDVADGKILRSITAEDKLLQKQLDEAANTAFEDCQRYLREIQSRECLLEVEPLMDGRTLYFHFLGNPDEMVTNHLQTLAEIFRETIQTSRFAKLLEEGCGPGCGTEEKGSCGASGTCTVCVIAKSCKK